MKYDYDYVIIGSGPGGLTVAIGLGVLGKKVCMIEMGHIGGDCTNYGCVPSKALLGYSKQNPGSGLVEAMRFVREKRQEVRDEETPEILSEYNVETRFGVGSFIDDHTLAIDHDGVRETITTNRVILCTGSKAKKLTIDGVIRDDLLTNHELFELDVDLKDLVIVGDGVIACEMAEAFVGLGVTVTLLSKHDEILDKYDRDLGEWMHGYLQKKGVRIITNAKPTYGNEGYLYVDCGGKEEKIRYEKILIAIGRVPLIDALNLSAVGVKSSENGVITTVRGHTNRGHIFAIGDCVADNPRFTHWSNHQGRILIQNLLAPISIFSPSIKNHPNPSTIYTDIEVATVGLQKDQAIQKYGKEHIIIRSLPFSRNDRSKLTESTDGFMTVICKRLSLNVVGVTIVGKNAGEQLPLYTYAIKHGVSLWRLSSLIFAYPTRGEIIKRIIDEYMHELMLNWQGEMKYALRRVFMFWK